MFKKRNKNIILINKVTNQNQPQNKGHSQYNRIAGSMVKFQINQFQAEEIKMFLQGPTPDHRLIKDYLNHNLNRVNSYLLKNIRSSNLKSSDKKG